MKGRPGGARMASPLSSNSWDEATTRRIQKRIVDNVTIPAASRCISPITASLPRVLVRPPDDDVDHFENMWRKRRQAAGRFLGGGRGGEEEYDSEHQRMIQLESIRDEEVRLWRRLQMIKRLQMMRKAQSWVAAAVFDDTSLLQETNPCQQRLGAAKPWSTQDDVVRRVVEHYMDDSSIMCRVGVGRNHHHDRAPAPRQPVSGSSNRWPFLCTYDHSTPLSYPPSSNSFLNSSSSLIATVFDLSHHKSRWQSLKKSPPLHDTTFLWTRCKDHHMMNNQDDLVNFGTRTQRQSPHDEAEESDNDNDGRREMELFVKDTIQGQEGERGSAQAIMSMAPGGQHSFSLPGKEEPDTPKDLDDTSFLIRHNGESYHSVDSQSRGDDFCHRVMLNGDPTTASGSGGVKEPTTLSSRRERKYVQSPFLRGLENPCSALENILEQFSENGKKDIPFPLKLHGILATSAYHDIISWLPQGKSWKIHQTALFEKILLPRHFRHAKYTSFMRQVNGWGFRRNSPSGPLEHNSYSHKLFTRDDPEKCLDMIRRGAAKNARGERVVVNMDRSRGLSRHEKNGG